MYIATKHIGNKYTPGEILPDDLPADMVDWLKEAGAIREDAPAPAMPPRIENPDKPDEEKELEALRADHASILHANGCAPDGNPLGETSTEQDEDAGDEETDAEEEEVEADEDAPAPEIDVMDGIVTAEPEAAEEKHPAKKPTTRQPAKRQAPKAAKTGGGRNKA